MHICSPSLIAQGALCLPQQIHEHEIWKQMHEVKNTALHVCTHEASISLTINSLQQLQNTFTASSTMSKRSE